MSLFERGREREQAHTPRERERQTSPEQGA